MSHTDVTYMADAHPADEWMVYSDIRFNQPTSLEERCECAASYLGTTGTTLPLVLDTMDNTAEEAYASWPER